MRDQASTSLTWPEEGVLSLALQAIMSLRDWLGSSHASLVVIFHDANSVLILRIISLLFTLKKFTYFWHLNSFVYAMTVNYTGLEIIPKPL